MKTASLLQSDWFDQAVLENAELEQAYENSRRSSVWFKPSRHTDHAQLMQQVLACCRSVARNHGLPKRTEIRLAGLKDIGAGAAGFKDAPDRFTRPFILLDKAPLTQFRYDEVMDVYCGIVLHEAGHILHTREGYRRLARDGRHPLVNMFENLFEDVRIEALVCRESPGYSPYIYAARYQLLHRGPFGDSMKAWKELPDSEKMLALLTAFVRIPQLIPPAARTWRTPSGDCVFESLRKLLPDPPATERDVEQMAERMYEYYRSHYPQECQESSGENDGKNAEPTGNDAISAAIARILGGDDAGKSPSSPSRPRPNRFAPADLQAAIESLNIVGESFDNATLQAVSAENGDGANVLIEKEWRKSGVERNIVVETAVINSTARVRYEHALASVKQLIPSMRAAIPQVGASRKLKRRDRTAGRLDSRRIALAGVSPRIFHTTTEIARAGVSIGLLLDASGSMRGNRETVARKTAVLITEAFASDPRVQLSVFSHSSPYNRDDECSIHVHFGAHQKDPVGIGAYTAAAMNFDDAAIETCHEILVKTSPAASKRILLVVSDGQPCGEYPHCSAVQSSAEAVKAARKTGTTVIGIGIDGRYCNDIYGDRWVINVANVGDLPRQLRNLLTRLFRSG